jgi:hypothetical protein
MTCVNYDRWEDKSQTIELDKQNKETETRIRTEQDNSFSTVCKVLQDLTSDIRRVFLFWKAVPPSYHARFISSKSHEVALSEPSIIYFCSVCVPMLIGSYATHKNLMDANVILFFMASFFAENLQLVKIWRSDKSLIHILPYMPTLADYMFIQQAVVQALSDENKQ